MLNLAIKASLSWYFCMVFLNFGIHGVTKSLSFQRIIGLQTLIYQLKTYNIYDCHRYFAMHEQMFSMQLD